MIATQPTRTRVVGRLFGGVAQRWTVFVVGVLLWQLVTAYVNDPWFPTPWSILGTVHDLWFSGPARHAFLTESAVDNILPSLYRLMTGWLLGSALGVALGIGFGRSRIALEFVEPLISFARAVPSPLLLPLFLVLFHIGTQMQLATITFGVLWPMLINTIDGAKSVDQVQADTARSFRVPRHQWILGVVLPAALPKIFAGLRISLSLALVLMVMSELIGATDGIGYTLILASHSFDTPGAVGGHRAARHPGQPAELAAAPRRTTGTELARVGHPKRGNEPMLEVTGLGHRFGDQPRVHGHLAAGRRGRTGLHRRPVRLRQVHAAAGDLRSDHADRGRHLAARQPRARDRARRSRRGVPGLQPLAVPVADRGGQRRVPAQAASLSKAERRERVAEALAWVGLADAGRKHPRQLSGGMQQRVSIARALAYRPALMLMDEPFASVDAQTRAELEDLLLRVRHEHDCTVLLVTHDIDESVYLGDRVLVLSRPPTTIVADLQVKLPVERDQITTRESDEFVALRGEVARLLHHDKPAPA